MIPCPCFLGAELFQFTPLREGRRDLIVEKVDDRTLFQFTPLREGRLMVLMLCPPIFRISIHAPPRGATPIPRP